MIDDEAGITLAAASSVDHELRGKLDGLTKTEQAKLVGKLVAERAKSKGITQVVFDRGGFRYIGRVKALADAAREAGLDSSIRREGLTMEMMDYQPTWNSNLTSA